MVPKVDDRMLKAQYFALYYGQRALHIGGKHDHVLYVGFDDMQNGTVRDSDYLMLISLNNISHDDLVKVGILEGLNKDHERFQFNLEGIKIELEHLVTSFKLKTYQYLQSKGYALPLHDMTVEQLINKGFLKLKENGRTEEDDV